VTGTGGPLVRGLALLVAALALALLPGDLAGSAAGLALSLLLPGYALVQCFRAPPRLGSWSDLLFCVAGSLAITPLALRLAGLVLPFDRPHVIGVLGGVTLGLLLLARLTRRAAATPAPGKVSPAVGAILIATLLLLIPALAIGPTPDGGETRVKGWDLNNHLAMAESIAARGLPPHNPFLKTDSPFYYHTFFHILLGAVLVIAGQGAHPYLLISILTLLLPLVFLATFHRVVSELTGDGRVALLALPMVSLVGGFDLSPMIARLLFDRGGSAAQFFLAHWNVDGWVSNQGMLVPSLFASFYWVPHAVAAMVVFLLALLCLRSAGSGLAAAAVAGACLASMAGYNGYIALAGGATLLLLGASDLVRFLSSPLRVDRDILVRSVLAGSLAILLGLPVLALYLGKAGATDKFRWARPGALLPIQLVLEFGPALILGLAGLLAWWREEKTRGALTPFFLMGIVTLPAVCLVASTGENNDLAMRMSMFLWIGLAVFSGLFLRRLFPPHAVSTPETRWARAASMAALGLGALSVAWFAIGASIAKPSLPSDEVAAGAWIRSRIPPGELVQASPLRDNPDLVYLSGHPAVLSDTWAARLFYAEPEEFERRMAALREAFSTTDPAAACASLRSMQVAVVVVGPPEERDFPRLAQPDLWPCLSPACQRGSYRVYRLNPQ